MGQIHCRFFTCSCDWKVCGSVVNLQRDILLIGLRGGFFASQRLDQICYSLIRFPGSAEFRPCVNTLLLFNFTDF